MFIRATTTTIEEHEVHVINLAEFRSRFPDAVIQHIDGRTQMKAPTTPGWYWRKHYRTGKWEPVEVFIAKPAPMLVDDLVGRLCYPDDTDNGNTNIVYDHGRWGGECLGMPQL